MALYEYAALCTHVVDGDTVDLRVDLGFHMSSTQRFRVLGIDTPELRGGTEETKYQAQLSKARVKELLMPGGAAQPIRIYTEKADSFGRWLARIMILTDLAEWRSLADILIEEGLGVPYAK